MSKFDRLMSRLGIGPRKSKAPAALSSTRPPGCPDNYVRVSHGDVQVWVVNDYLKIPYEGISRTVFALSMPPAPASYLMGSARVAESVLDDNHMLPDPALVDAIWQQADLRIAPVTYEPWPGMTNPSAGERHSRDLFHRDRRLGKAHKYALVAGHKKDVVRSHRPERTAIYGWHQPDGRVIQRYSTVHGHAYTDYSQAIRPVWKFGRTADGRLINLKD